jgi:Ca2+-binding RTX toxin-like protein
MELWRHSGSPVEQKRNPAHACAPTESRIKTMATFTGTDADEIITPQFVSPTVMATGGIRPSNASDVIDGGAGNDTIDGGGGDDTIRGGDGNDLLIGGAGNDTIIGGRGNDVAFLGAGDDLFIWNPGEGSDVVEGGGGFDTLDFVGADVSENVSISANGGGVTFSRDVGNVTMDLNSVERIQFEAAGGADNIVVNDLTGTHVKQVAINLAALGTTSGDGQPDTVTINAFDAKDKISIVSTGSSVVVNGLSEQVTIDGAEAANDKLVINGLGGNDTIDASGLAAGLINLAIDGGDGNDRIIGSGGADKLIGGAGNDVVTGGAGDDVALLGDGDDRFIWNPGDGSDVVEGGAGYDTLDFRGSDASETFTISANGTRALLTRDVGNVSMDLNGVEQIQLAAAGGADTITINDLTGTDVKEVAIDLAGTSSGDGHQVIVNGTAGNDNITIGHHGGAVTVNGLAETVSIRHADGLDQLKVSAGAGDDVIDASGLPANHIGLILDGGAGNDTILGSHGNDTVIGGTGNDVALLGAGDDLFIWNPGDGSDVVDGGAGFDTLDFRGANANENVSISAHDDHVLFSRDVGNVTMDLHSIERIQFEALGGTDNVVVNDLTGTDVKEVAINLAGAGGAGDGQVDTVTVNATDGCADQISVLSSGASVVVNGLSEQVTIDGADDSLTVKDSLTIKALGGNDTIDASGLNAGQIKLVIDGGAGNDTITGSRGDDVLIGGAGDDKFVFTFGQTGHDVIQDFQAHGTGTQGDTIALAGFSDHTFEQAVADGHIAQAGSDVAISDGTSIVATLQNVSLASLHANDFLFT